MNARATSVTERRRQREKLARRHAILTAAERVFAEKGFERATMEDVAKAAEFSVGAIYNFFENKDALRAEVMAHVAEEFQAAFRSIAARQERPIDAIVAVVELRFRYMEEHAAFFRRVMDAKPGGRMTPDHAIPASCHKRYDAYLDDLAALFSKAIAAGEARAGDPRYFALSLEGAINAYWAYWRRRGITLSTQERLEAVRRNCLHMIWRSKGAEKHEHVRTK